MPTEEQRFADFKRRAIEREERYNYTKAEAKVWTFLEMAASLCGADIDESPGEQSP